MKRLVAEERAVTAELIAHLAELDTRDLYLRLGYPTLFVYCRDVLGLTEWESYNRTEVARAARSFPVILEWLADGSLNITAVKLLAPHLTSHNHRDVLQEARGKKKAAIGEMVARLSPRPDVPTSVRRLPGRHDSGDANLPADHAAFPVRDSVVRTSGAGTATFGAPALEMVPREASGAPGAPTPVAQVRRQISAAPPTATTPLCPDRYRLQVTIGGETLEKMRLAKDMLGHAVPTGDDAAILDRAFSALLAELAKKKFADTRTPRLSKEEKTGDREQRVRPSKAVSNPAPAMIRKPPARAPSATIKRAVWLRDLGRCAFVGTGGHRCNERRFVEFHHVDPYALGGEATVDGIQLRCRRHNDYEGKLYFGDRRRAARQADLVPEQPPRPRPPAAPLS